MSKIYYFLVALAAMFLAFAAVYWLFFLNSQPASKTDFFDSGSSDLQDLEPDSQDNKNTLLDTQDSASFLKDRYKNKGFTKEESPQIIEEDEGSEEQAKGADVPYKFMLVELFDMPVVSVYTNFADKKLVFTEKLSGNTFAKNSPDEKNTRISQNTTKDVQSVIYGESVLIKEYLDENLLPFFELEFIFDKTKKYKLPSNFIKCASITYKNKFFCQKLTDKGSVFSIISFDDDKNLQEKEIFSSPLIYWELLASKDRYFIYQSPNDSKQSVVMEVKDGKAKVLAQLYSLDALVDNDGSYILYSGKIDGKRKMFLMNLKNSKVTDLPFASFADKCAFVNYMNAKHIICAVPDTDIPLFDRQLKGRLSRDSFWLYNVENGSYQEVNIESKENIDAKDLRAEKNGEFVIFINKVNSKALAIIMPQQDEQKEQNDEKDNKENNENNN